MTPDDEALLTRLPADHRAANGIPTEEQARDRERAFELVSETLGEHLQPRGLRISPLGPAWSTDIDVHVTTWPSDEPLRQRGWICVDGVLGRLGSPGRGRWAVVDGNRIVGSVDVHLVPPHRPVDGIVARCRRRREVRAREVLELRRLRREGHDLPSNDVVAAAANAEAALGGNELGDRRAGDPELPPIALSRSRTRGVAAALVRPRARLVVAVSGVDGAGKSTLVTELDKQLRAAGVPSTIVWTRPGLHLGGLEGLARRAKRVLRQDDEPGIRRVARGATDGQISRRGPIGWLWSLLVTLSFLRGVRKAHARSGGVLLFDRHLLDALATLEFAYGGVNLRLQRALIKRLLPRAAASFYLDISVDEAVARKRDDVFGELAVERQLTQYSELLDDYGGVTVLDATETPDRLAARVLDAVLDG